MTTQPTIDLRQQGDELADEAFEWLKANPEEYEQLLNLKTNAELAQLLNVQSPLSKLAESVLFAEQIDFDQLRSASLFFETHTQNILPILGLYSLPYCYAGANGVKVLYASKKIKDDPFRRLLETAQYVFDCCQVGGFSDQGKAMISTLKVRLMHAAARYYTSKQIKNEIPVNQEDMVGTLLSFSLLVLRGLKAMGVSVSKDDTQHYFYLWQVLGQMMGIKKDYLPQNIRQASNLERSIRRKEFKASMEGQALTRALIDCIKRQEGAPQRPGVESVMAYFLGDEVSKMLGVNADKLSREVVGTGFNFQNFFTRFNQANFQSQLKQFEQTKLKAGVQPKFEISFD